ncbi:MAG: DUF2723 domain-containing protein [Prolixibacteraceae bacterium]|nr:DUF2723 domain-containing protein [Prolixibacteraceae bacterium]
MKKFKLINTLLGWAMFLISLIVYLFTVEPSVSFWDCGEFIASAYKLQVGHPPGAPFFMIIARVVSLFAPSPDEVAHFINAFSALVSAATILFLHWTIVRLAVRFSGNDGSVRFQILAFASGVIGSLAFAFTDTFWFSAVEAEVYAFSSLFTAIVFWAILRWEQVANEKHANRWILLIAYLIGLSIGVHLLNLLAIPAIALIWYFKKYKPTTKGVIVTLALSFLTIIFIMYGIIQGIPSIAQKFEILFVNTFGLPYNSGMLFFIFLTVAVLVGLIVYTHKKQKPIANLLVVSVMLIIMGFSSYAAIMIRSRANPPMDENNPENSYTLMKYLNRSQYGSTPLVSGYYFNAPAVSAKKGKPVYFPKNGKYIKMDGPMEYKYDDRFKTMFPRMYSTMGNHKSGYKMWGKIKGRPVSLNGKTEYVPTFAENLRFFFSYQINHMYIRYFMWNFSGRQNDNQGHGDIFNGNWLTGFGFIDKARLGHNGDQPYSMANPETTNRYYMLPFLLGLIGLIIHFKQNKKDFWVVMVLFILTGIAIVGFLNQPPFQPRERDYAYAGSFYTFAIWIGLGVIGINQFLQKYLKKRTYVPAVILSCIVPVMLIAENYDDHDRSGRYVAHDLGRNYLNSCEKNAVLFTYGDNDTFPLWYVQDVENERPDVRICNVTLLNGDWYIDQMKRKVYDSDPLPIKMDNEKYEFNNRNTMFVRDDIKRPVELSTLLNIVLSEDPRTKLQTQGGGAYDFFPSKQVKITVDKQKVLETNTVSPEMADQIVDSIVFEISSGFVSKSDLAILDMLANNHWERPIYFDLSVVHTINLKLDKYLRHEGFAYRFLPIANNTSDPFIDADLLYTRVMDQFVWGNLNDPDIFIDENLQKTTEIVRIKPTFYRLAEKLFAEGQDDKALEVIDRLYEILPLGMYFTSYYDVYCSAVYYRNNLDEKGDELLKTVANECLDKIDFYIGLGSAYIDSYNQKIKRETSVIKEVMRIAEKFERKELVENIENQLAIITAKAES